MGSHSVSCHLTQVNTPRLNPSQTGQNSIYLPQRAGGHYVKRSSNSEKNYMKRSSVKVMMSPICVTVSRDFISQVTIRLGHFPIGSQQEAAHDLPSMGLGLPGSLPSYHIIYTFCCLFLIANKIVLLLLLLISEIFSLKDADTHTHRFPRLLTIKNV